MPLLRLIPLLVAFLPLVSSPQDRDSIEQARARWEHMSPAERARIAQHFDEFRGLPEEERQRMLAHLNRVAEARREIEARIPDELRTKLEQLEPAERREVLREYVESSMGERAERLREKLPKELVQKLESATPEEREQLLRSRREELRERAPRMLAFLGRQLELPPEEIERLNALPPAEMLGALAELGRREMQRRGPPPGVDPQEFRGWLELPPPEFMERMHCHGMRGFRGDPEHGGPPGARPQFGEPGSPDGRGRPGPEGSAPEGRGRPGMEGRSGLEGRDGLEGHDGERGLRGPPPDGPRGPRRESRLAPDAQNQVLRALRADPQWIVELASLPREERRAQIQERIHARVIELLRAQSSVTSDELARLDAAHGREFFEALREIVGDPPRGQGEHHRREHRDEPPPQK